MWISRNPVTDPTQSHLPTLRFHGRYIDDPFRHAHSRHSHRPKAEGKLDEATAQTYWHPISPQTPGKNVSAPGTRIGTDAGIGRPRKGKLKGRSNEQSGGMHVIRYSFLSAVIAILWYGFRIGRAWWEMP